MRIKLIKYVCFLIASIVIFGCANNQKKADTANSGEIFIACDENIKPIVEAQIDVFTSIYSKSDFKLKSSSEQDVYNSFMNDSTRLIIGLRELNKKETEFFIQSKLTIKTNVVATDAIAFVMNKNRTDSNITYQNLEKILNGTILNWSDLGSKEGTISVVLDNPASGNARYLREKLGENSLNGKNIFAVNSGAEVISFIQKNENAIGIIGANWLSDTGDSISDDYLSRIKVLAISPSKTEKNINLPYYKPLQGDLREGYYPFIRSMFVISKESRTGLGTGFASFMKSERGQRIFLKGGLMPIMMPSREIQFNN